MVDYIEAGGGKRSSEQLVSEFRAGVADPTLFKQLLKEAAQKDRGGYWVLKPSFRRADADGGL
jgi:hypothetical protein